MTILEQKYILPSVLWTSKRAKIGTSLNLFKLNINQIYALDQMGNSFFHFSIQNCVN